MREQPQNVLHQLQAMHSRALLGAQYELWLHCL